MHSPEPDRASTRRFASAFGSGCAIDEPGDPVAIGVFNATSTTHAGPRTAWGSSCRVSRHQTSQRRPRAVLTAIWKGSES